MNSVYDATMFSQVMSQVSTLDFPAYATYLGLIFSALAFVQAKRAKDAAEDTKESLRKVDSVHEISTSIPVLIDVQGCFRSGMVNVVPDKLISAHSNIARVKNSCLSLGQDERDRLTEVCVQLLMIKNYAERFIESEKFENVQISKVNRILTDQIDSLQTVLCVIKGSC